MTSVELQGHFSRLDLQQNEAAKLLGVTVRTVRRWFEGEAVPGAVDQAVRAWLRLQDRGLPWRPDTVSIVEDDQEQIRRYRDNAIDLNDLLNRVEQRGGPRLPWEVDREKCRAILGKMEISYYNRPNGGFSLGYYTRRDGNPDVKRDWEFIEDAAYCISLKTMNRDSTTA